MKNLNFTKPLSPEAYNTFYYAQLLADQRKHNEYEPIHLLSVLLDREDVRDVMRAARVDLAALDKDVATVLTKIPTTGKGNCLLSRAIVQLFADARKEAGISENDEQQEERKVTIVNLLNALARDIRSSAGTVLQKHDLMPGVFRAHSSLIREDGTVHTNPPEVHNTQPLSSEKDKNSNRYLKDLVNMAKHDRFDPVIGRDTEVRRVMQILDRRGKNHPLLVGEPGVGKFSIVAALAMRLAHNDVPEHLKKLALLELNAGSLLAGAKMRGEEVEKRLNQIFAFLKDKPVILYVRNIEQLANQPSGDLIRQLLMRDGIRLLASTSVEGSRKLKESGTLDEFTVLSVDPSTVEHTTQILRGLAPRYEVHHKISIGEEPIAAAVRLAKRYLQDRFLPASAIDLLDESASRKRIELDGTPSATDAAVKRLSSLRAQHSSLSNDHDPSSVKALKKLDEEIAELEPKVRELQKQDEVSRVAPANHRMRLAEMAKLTSDLDAARMKKDYARAGKIEHELMPIVQKQLDNAAELLAKVEQPRMLTEEDVAAVLEDWTGVAASKMLEGEIEQLKGMDEKLKQNVVGQDEAVLSVSQAVRRARLGLRDPKRPIGSFLFLGSSGVGKTLIAKSLAELLFGSADNMVRIDMAEYREPHQAQKLIGSPVGYVGSQEGGMLTNAVRKKPNSLLLFDEIEKGSVAVNDMLLAVLEDGRLTDGLGQTSFFNESVVVMTSNIGTKRLLDADPALFDTEEGRKKLSDDLLHNDLKEAMRPEFINRIDNIIVFRPLLKDTLLKVADIELRAVNKMLEQREITVSVSDAAKLALVEEDAVPSLGARPLKRAIVKRIQNRLTDELLTGKYKPGDVMKVDYVDGIYTFGV